MTKNRFGQNFLIKSHLLIILSTLSFISFSQNEKLFRSLDYINDQFKKFNTYDLQFQLNIEAKILISKSIYFEVTYPINQINSIYSTKRGDKDCVVFFKCQNDEQCISSLNMKDKSTDLKSEYSFNLHTTPEIADKVVMEFMAIKNEINNSSTTKTEVAKPVDFKTELNSDIDYINKMLKKYNSFNILYRIDWTRKVLQSQSEYFEVTYNPLSLGPIELISRGENDYKINFTCKSDATCLTSVDLRNNDTELKSNYPVNFTGNADEVQKVISTFNHVLLILNK